MSKLPQSFSKIKEQKLLQILVIVLISEIIILIPLYGLDWPEWTGFGRTVTETIESPGRSIEYKPQKTLWDILELLIVPLILAGGAYWLQQSGKKRELYLQDQQSQNVMLQSYLDKITDLFGKKQNFSENWNDAEKALLRGRTLATLNALGFERKSTIIKFLIESDSINSNKAIINLGRINLEHIDLSRINFKNINLQDTILNHANLYNTELTNVNFERAMLKYANLSKATLLDVKLCYANLEGADLSFAKFTIADFDYNPGENKSSANEIALDNALREHMNEDFYKDTNKIYREEVEKEIKENKENLNSIKYKIHTFLAEGKVPLSEEEKINLERLRAEANQTRVSQIKSEEEYPSNYINLKLLENQYSEKIKTLEEELNRLIIVDLYHANLTNANLSKSDLRYANFRYANMLNAVLKETNLTGADLREAKNLTVKQLKKAKTLFQAKLDFHLLKELETQAPELLR